MEYLIEGKKYHFSYRELQEKYYELSFLTLEEFLDRLPEVLHFAVFVCWFKERGNECLSDVGVIHELVHLLHIKDEPLVNAEKIKKQFEEELKL